MRRRESGGRRCRLVTLALVSSTLTGCGVFGGELVGPSEVCNVILLTGLADNQAPVAVPREVVAHKGFPRCFPENTVEAIQGVEWLRFRTIELDVRMTRDGVPVLMHDSTVSRTTNGAGFVRDLTLRELRTLDACPLWSIHCPVPTLAEALHAVPDQMNVLLDLKDDFDVADRAVVAAAIQASANRERRQLLISGLELVERFRLEHPDISIAFVHGPSPDSQRTSDRLRQLGVETLVVSLRVVFDRPDFIRAHAAEGFEVVAATVENRRQFEMVTEVEGVGRILSDIPIRTSCLDRQEGRPAFAPRSGQPGPVGCSTVPPPSPTSR